MIINPDLLRVITEPDMACLVKTAKKKYCFGLNDNKKMISLHQHQERLEWLSSYMKNLGNMRVQRTKLRYVINFIETQKRLKNFIWNLYLVLVKKYKQASGFNDITQRLHPDWVRMFLSFRHFFRQEDTIVRFI